MYFIFAGVLNTYSQKLENPITEAYIKKHLAKKSPKLILTSEIEKTLKRKLKSDELVQIYYMFLQEEANRILELLLSKHELKGF